MMLRSFWWYRACAADGFSCGYLRQKEKTAPTINYQYHHISRTIARSLFLCYYCEVLGTIGAYVPQFRASPLLCSERGNLRIETTFFKALYHIDPERIFFMHFYFNAGGPNTAYLGWCSGYMTNYNRLTYWTPRQSTGRGWFRGVELHKAVKTPLGRSSNMSSASDPEFFFSKYNLLTAINRPVGSAYNTNKIKTSRSFNSCRFRLICSLRACALETYRLL